MASAFEHFYAQLNGIRIHFVQEGRAAPGKTTVVLCHGWPDLWFGWRHQIKAIARAGYHVVVPDLRGFGETDAPEGVEHYGPKSITGDLAALLDHLKVTKAVFIGHDWGGHVVWRMGLFHPDRVLAIASLCTPYTPRHNTYVSVEQLAELVPTFYYQYYLNSDEAEKEINENTDLLFRYMYRGTDPEELKGVKGKMMADKKSILGNIGNPPRSALLSQEELDYYVQQYQKRGSKGGLMWYRNRLISWEQEAAVGRKIPHPALMVTAERDPVLRPWMADKMEVDVPNLTRANIDDAGHFVMFERPAKVNKILIDWLHKVAPPSLGSKL